MDSLPDKCQERLVVAALQEFAQRNQLPKKIHRITSLEELDGIKQRRLLLKRCGARFRERYQMLNLYQRIKRPLSVQNLVLQYRAMYEEASVPLNYRRISDSEREARNLRASQYKPMLKAYNAGAGLIFITKDTIYWTPHMKIPRDPEGRIHGNASWLGERIPIWHGTVMPPRFLYPEQIDPKSVLLIGNAEVRRSACEIIGWEKILSVLESVVIDNHRDPQIGTLVEVNLPNGQSRANAGERARFLMVKCGTGRNFSIRVPPATRTVNEAQRIIFGLQKFVPPEVRT